MHCITERFIHFLLSRACPRFFDLYIVTHRQTGLLIADFAMCRRDVNNLIPVNHGQNVTWRPGSAGRMLQLHANA
jgi:hypothetical protein